jgi:uncharacterized protein YxeA
MNAMGLAITIVIMLACAILGMYLWFKVYNSDSGERYIKQRMQAPFVPEDAEDIAAHQSRAVEKSVEFADSVKSLKQNGKI